MKLSPRTRRDLSRILPFGLIWLLTGWVFLAVETAAMGTRSPDSTVIIDLTFPVFVFASIAVFLLGLLVGMAELLFMERWFRSRPFIQKVLYKFILYALMMLAVIFITYPVAASLESGLSLLDRQIWARFLEFLGSLTFFSTLLQMGASIMLSTIYAAMSENLGHAVMINFLTGRYHQPRKEKRIFMFLDMKASTTVAEKLGHHRYFDFLRHYYADLTNAIIDHLGEVYQYVGDEVVINWKYRAGLKNNNCLRCFYAMKEALQKRSDFYNEMYGYVPSFKAGLHMGEVTTGEIGALKKEIFFTGDVLNTTARIQGMCSQYGCELLVSGRLFSQLQPDNYFVARALGKETLKGKSETVELYSIEIKKP